MIKTTTLLLILLSAIQNALWAQLAPELTKKYSWHIVSRVIEINNIVNLPVEKQLGLANLFNREDSLAKVYLNLGLTAEQVRVNSEITNEMLLKVLSPQEFSHYFVSTTYKTDSQFSSALSYKTILGLNDAQVRKLEVANRDLKYRRIYNMRTRNSFPFSEPLFEGKYLKEILNEMQYSRFLALHGKAIASDRAANTWNAIKDSELATDADSAKLNTQIMNYYVLNEAGLLRIAHGVTKLKEDSIHKSFNKRKPAILIKLDALAGGGYNSQLTKAIKNRHELVLNTVQLTRLLDAQVMLEKKVASLNKGEVFNSVPFEGVQLGSILNDKQYNDFLRLDAKSEAQALVDETWIQFERYKFKQIPDSVTLSNQMFNYFSDRQIARSKMKNGVRSIDVDSLLKSIELSKPLMLVKLDGYRNMLPVSNFATAIKYKKQLTITDPQLDSLIKKIQRFEVLKNENFRNESHGKLAEFNERKYEIDELLGILEPKQLTLFFYFKNYPHALELTNRNWVKIRKYGLNAGLDSATVNKQNFTYHINMLSTADRTSFNMVATDSESKIQSGARKPMILAKIDEMDKKRISGDAAKRSFAW